MTRRRLQEERATRGKAVEVVRLNVTTRQTGERVKHGAGHKSYDEQMREIAAREAKNQFGQLLDAAQRAPVRVTKKGARWA